MKKPRKIKIKYNGIKYLLKQSIYCLGRKLLFNNTLILFSFSDEYQYHISYFKDGRYHREDGPAFQCRRSTEYYFKGELHRVDGPAVIYNDPYYINEKYQYYYFGERIICSSDEEFKRVIKLKILW